LKVLISAPLTKTVEKQGNKLSNRAPTVAPTIENIRISFKRIKHGSGI
jgi:hypothetical protein